MPISTEPHLRQAPRDHIQTDICIVGGGMAGLCAAIAAARHGKQVVVLQDRPVLGGNASSEVRMWICGAHGPDYKESGILEEIQLENLYRNTGLKYTIWDTVLYGKAREENNIDLRLNCAVCEVQTDSTETRIESVTAWHLTRQCWLQVSAQQFIDCSGDSILRLSGATTRWGRESQEETAESAALDSSDRKTMGNSILIQLREIDPADHQECRAPAWAKSFPEDHHRLKNMKPTGHNFWWLEIGGEQDTIADADSIRDELMAIAYGSWAFIKNHPDGRGHGWELEWIGALPGKRENVRYVGAYTLTQEDIEARGQFPDVIAYGGWTMDDHPPAAFNHPGNPTTHYPAPSPYGIPYGCLYGKDIENLQFAGRNISATHMALSSTRVMATCAMLGQAVGTAATLCLEHQCQPAEVASRHMTSLQNMLLDDDQWLPGRRRNIPSISKEASLSTNNTHDPQPLLDGLDRKLDGDMHAWTAQAGDAITFTWAQAVSIDRLRLVADSQLHRTKRMPCNWPKRGWSASVPDSLPRDFSIEQKQNGAWKTVCQVDNNRRRLIVLEFPPIKTTELRITFHRSWGSDMRIFSCECGRADRTQPIENIPWPSPVWTGKGRA